MTIDHTSPHATPYLMDLADTCDDFQVIYAVYIERVRFLLRRYVLALDVMDPGGVEGQEPCPSVAMQALLDLPPSRERQVLLKGFDHALRAADYDTLADQAPELAVERFEALRWEFGLSECACDILWVMLAGRMNPHFLWLYRTLWGDVQGSYFDRTFLTHVVDPYGRRTREVLEAFDPMGPLLAHRLIVELKKGSEEEADGVLSPSRRLIWHLHGLKGHLPHVPGLIGLHPPQAPVLSFPLPPHVLERLRVGHGTSRRFVLIGPESAEPLSLARRVASEQGIALIEADARGLLAGGDAAVVTTIGEARLRGAALYIKNIDALESPDVPPALVRQCLERLEGARVFQFFHTSIKLSPHTRLHLSDRLGAVEIRLDVLNVETRGELWRSALEGAQLEPEEAREVAFSARAYPLGATEIDHALALARLQARQRNLRAPKISSSDVERACQSLSLSHLGELARRVEVRNTWDDVVLDEDTRSRIDDILRYGRYRAKVLDDFGYGNKMSYGKALTALFWGAPGTGKTMVSGLLARELGLDLFVVELSQIASRYVGETEQRLARIFDEAAECGMALLFDEADSLFSKRTAVKSSTDRYANQEVNFLLQRLERHDGLVILTSNHPKAIDPAFMRRLRFKIEFSAPDVPERERLWKSMIPPGAPQEDDIPFLALAEVFDLTGGDIRNAVLRAAFYAAEEGAPLGLRHLDQAAQVEYREAGRLLGTSATIWWENHRAGRSA